MDSMQQQQQQRREEQILSLFESIEDRELRRSAPGELAAPDQFAAPWEPTDFRVPEAAPAGPAAAPGPTPAWSTASVTGTAPAVAATQPPGAVVVKRRRGRPPKNAALLNGQSNTLTPLALQLSKPVEEEEDVCFICFDGGSLVLCDRKGCPKAYHPACIKRDESFFQSRAKWMCGWHLCSTCEKGAYYMCYTCTYSLCKNCTKDADYVCVRGTKGLCGICMKTIMMIEKIPHGNQEMAQVDFDDKTSWEYLFKIYWVILKEKLSLTINELTQAKNPWIEPSFPIPTVEPSGNLNYSNGDRRYGSGSSNGYQSARVLRGRPAKEQPKLNDKEAQSEQVNPIDERLSSHDAKWASEELLDFVAHMKNGDTSVLSQFDVQALLLEYIRKNNLRDTRRKCQIVCDSRLLSLFGKTTLGHFEMLKLLDSHFLVKENPKIDAFIRGSIVHPGSFQVNNSSNGETQPTLDSNKRRKTRKKVDERVPQVNPDDYAAADAHNISLIYLQKSLMEKLLDDPETFHDKIVGSVVRIKVSDNDQKQDIYRLVRVVGTSKVAEPYNAGDKIAGVVLEVMNLDKQELMRIDEISDQEFSEDECGGLRQNIKSGKIKWHTVGELQQKALQLQEVRVNQWLEAELLRLNHLHDRASEKGLEKEECVEKIQILNSPEERQRRMQAIPDVHGDRGLDPNHIPKDEHSGLHQKIQDGPDKPTSGRGRKRRPVISAESNNHTPNKRKNATRGNQPAASDSESGLTYEMNKRTQFDPAVAAVCTLKSSASVSESASAVVSEVSPSPLSTGTDHSVNDGASYKMWRYQDPSGKTQGPFAMAQLRIWNASGHFPPDLRIWKIGETQEDSILLSEALIGNYIKQEPRVSDDRPINLNGSVDESPSQRDMNIAEGSPNLREERPMSPGKVKDEVTDKVIEGLTSSEGRIITVAEVWDSLNDDAHLSLVQPQLCSPAQLPGNQSESPLQGTEGQESRQDNAGLSLFRMTEAVAGANHGHESNSKESAGNKQVGRLSGQNWKAPGPVITTDSSDKTLEAAQQRKDIDVHDLPNAAAIRCSEGLENNGERKKQSMSLNVPDQDPARSWSSAPSLMAGSTRPKEVANEWGGGFSGPKPVDEWDSTLGSSSSMRPADMAGSNAALTSANTQSTIAESSQTHNPLPIESSWQAIVNETNDFASLGEESVSDLLAEVEAMENGGLPSPTSAMKCGHDLNDDGKDDCFSPIEGFDPTPGPVKSEVFSSTVDLIVTSQPTVTTHVQQPNGASNGDLSDARRTSHRHSSSSTETERGGKHQNEGMTGNQWKSGSTSEHHQRPSAIQTTWQLPGPPANHWGGVVQGSSQWEGTNHGHTNMEWEARQGQYQRTGSFGSGSGSGSPGIWSNQQRYSSGSGRYNSPRDRSSQGADQGYSRSSRGPWSSTSNSNSRPYSSGGGYRQQPPKGQRVCKFYESGYCKRGASCSYFHP